MPPKSGFTRQLSNEIPSWEIKPSHCELERGYKAFSAAILPKHPLIELTQQNISDGCQGLVVWEQSEDISEKYFLDSGNNNLVTKMLTALEYTLAHPGVPGLDIVSLQSRCKVLQKKIYKKLLGEYLKGNTNPSVSSATAHWITEIERNILNPGSHHLSWYTDNFRKILGFLEISSPVEKYSPVAHLLNRVLYASYIPHLDHLKVVRDILFNYNTFDSNAGATYERRFSDAIDPKVIPEFSIITIQKAIEEIQHASQNHDFLTVQKILSFFETMPGTNDEKILAAVQLALLNSASTIEKSGVTGEVNLVRSLYTAGRTIRSSSTHRSIRPSFYSSDAVPGAPVIQITFQDTSVQTDSSYRKHTDLRTWRTITLEATPDEPMESLLVRFSAQANAENRHPFFHVAEFDFHVEPSAEGHNHTLHFGKKWFTQGKVGDILSGSNIVSYDRHDGLDDLKEEMPPLRMIFPFQRQYPPSGPQPPENWVPAPGLDGPWQEISTLQFMGDGAELTAHATYPPIIAQTILMPIDLSLISTKGLMLRRLRVPPKHLGEKLAFPLTVDQARSLLGRTVFYHSADGEEQPVIRRPVLNRRPKPEPKDDPIYMAYVWGLDPDARILMTVEHANEPSGELCRAFQFDGSGAPLPEEIQTASLSNGYPGLRKVSRFEWIGLVDLPMPAGPTKDEIAAKEALARQRKRFAEILAAAPPFFEVGINDDRAIVVGELNMHAPESSGTVTVENCKAGIWESGYANRENDDEDFLMWVRWVKNGIIDLNGTASTFARSDDDGRRPLDVELVWEDSGMISVDGGIAAILARGILAHSSVTSLIGNRDTDSQRAFLEMVILSGSEDGRYHVPGGVSSYTGGDGVFLVQISKDSQGAVVALRVVGNGGMEDKDDV